MSSFSVTWMLWVFYFSMAAGLINLMSGLFDRNSYKVKQGLVIIALYSYPVWEHLVSVAS